MNLLVVLCIVALCGSCLATVGVDVSTLVSTSGWSCMTSSGYDFAVVRGYRSSGSVDPNAATNIRNARAGGMAHVDAYVFPCYSCGNPMGQISATVNALQGTGYGMIWLDIEGPGYWSSSTSSNVKFISQMMNQLETLGVNYGIYTSSSQWGPITGGWTGASSRPLWYAHYDGNPSFSDFSSFGGWSEPAIKQYVGDATLCGYGVDKNYY